MRGNRLTHSMNLLMESTDCKSNMHMPINECTRGHRYIYTYAYIYTDACAYACTYELLHVCKHERPSIVIVAAVVYHRYIRNLSMPTYTHTHAYVRLQS